MKYYFDCEFLEDGFSIDLISIAFVAEDGREYYAVNLDAEWDRIREDKWLMKNVVPHLPRESEWKRKHVIAAEVLEFLLAGDGSPELWAWFSAYDHVTYAQLWGKMIDLPKGLPMYTNDVKSLLNWVVPRVQDRSGFPAQAEGLHDALADARHVKVRYDWIMERQDGTAKLAASLLAKKKSDLAILQKDLGYAIDNDLRMRESVLREQVGTYSVEVNVLEALLNG